MSKKKSADNGFSPDRKTNDNSTEKESLEENKNPKLSRRISDWMFTVKEGSGKKTLSKRFIVIIACLCAAVIVLSVALPIGIIYGNRSTTPEPFFDAFNDETDYYIKVRWNKIRDAGLYECQYCYGDPNEEGAKIDNGQTENEVYPLRRHKGKIFFRVKAMIAGENTEYSDWISTELSAWKLQTPIVTISDTLAMSWVSSTYKVDDKVVTIRGYEYKMFIDGEELVNTGGFSGETSLYINKVALIKSYKSDVINEYELTGNWTDFEFELQVRAVTYTEWQGNKITNPVGNEVVLDAIYEYSDYGSAKITVTKEIYEQLTLRS